MTKLLRVFTVYAQPSDYPDDFVLRGFTIEVGAAKPDSQPTAVGTLEHVRSAVPKGRHRIARQPTDDPVILETWV